MAIEIHRCSHCGREVLVRLAILPSEAEVSRRMTEEMRPDAAGQPARPQWSDRMRDDIWLGISSLRTPVPRDKTPAACPACGRDALELARVLDQ